MDKMNVNGEQVALACRAGLELLNDKDLKVSGSLAMSGALPILQGLLMGIVNGQVAVVNVTEESPDPDPVSD